MITYLMDAFPSMAAIRNQNKQSALHVCLENSAIESYQLLIQCRSSDLDIKEEDVFGVTPISKWKRIMEQKREKSIRFLFTCHIRLFLLPPRGVQNADHHSGAIRLPQDVCKSAASHRPSRAIPSRIDQVSAPGADSAIERAVVSAVRRKSSGALSAVARRVEEGGGAVGVSPHSSHPRLQLHHEAGERLRQIRSDGCASSCRRRRRSW